MPLLWLIFILIGVAIYRSAQSGNIPETEIIERWSCLLPNQGNASEELMTIIESELNLRDCSYAVKRKTLSLGFVSSNPFIKVSLNPVYSCFIGYEIVGKDIHVNWSIREKMSWVYNIPFIGPWLYRLFHVVTFVDRNKLLAFASFTKDCTQNAVDSLFDKYELDKTKVVRTSSGKLGPL